MLDLLHRLYGNIITTLEVAKEFDEPLPSWITLNEISDKHMQQLLELQVDVGEASAEDIFHQLYSYEEDRSRLQR